MSTAAGPRSRPRTRCTSRLWFFAAVVLWHQEYGLRARPRFRQKQVLACSAVFFLLLSNPAMSTLTGRRRTATGTRPWDGRRASGGGGAVSDSHGGDKEGWQPGGRRTKETGGRAERMQREHGHSSTVVGSAPAGSGGQAGGRVLCNCRIKLEHK